MEIAAFIELQSPVRHPCDILERYRVKLFLEVSWILEHIAHARYAKTSPLAGRIKNWIKEKAGFDNEY